MSQKEKHTIIVKMKFITDIENQGKMSLVGQGIDLVVMCVSVQLIKLTGGD